MIVHCAWCEKAGRDPYLGEKEPLSDPSVSHGMCERCLKEMTEQVARELGPMKNPPKRRKRKRK